MKRNLFYWLKNCSLGLNAWTESSVNMTTPAVNRKKQKQLGMLTMLKVTVFKLTSLFLYFVILFAYVSWFIFLRLLQMFFVIDLYILYRYGNCGSEADEQPFKKYKEFIEFYIG
jgi:hypothetical protein